MPVVPRIDTPPTMPRRALTRSLGELFAAFDGDLHLDVGAAGMGCCDFLDSRLNHPARRRVDGRLSRWDRQAGQRHHAHTRTGAENDTAAGGAETDGRADQRAVGHVRVVARVLDDAGRGGVAVARRFRQGKTGAEPARQRYLHRIEELAGDKRGKGRLGRRRRAGAGGPPPAQRLLRFHAERYSGTRAACHGLRSSS